MNMENTITIKGKKPLLNCIQFAANSPAGRKFILNCFRPYDPKDILARNPEETKKEFFKALNLDDLLADCSQNQDSVDAYSLFEYLKSCQNIWMSFSIYSDSYISYVSSEPKLTCKPQKSCTDAYLNRFSVSN